MTPSPAPDRLTALIDEVARSAALRGMTAGGSPDATERYHAALAALRAEAASVEERLARAEEALAFYADSPNWSSPSRGFALQYDPEPSPVAKDCGQRAKDALAARATTPEGNHAK